MFGCYWNHDLFRKKNLILSTEEIDLVDLLITFQLLNNNLAINKRFSAITFYLNKNDEEKVSYIFTETSILTIVIRNEEVVWKQGLLEHKISGVAVQNIHQNNKKQWVCEELLSENGFEAVLAAFCCYDCGAYASETVETIATDQNDYSKWFSCGIVC